MKQADSRTVSEKAKQRGVPQGGTLGSGNHFLEMQVVSEIFDPEAAEVFGLSLGQCCCMIHCGSRGLGHQVCTDHLKLLETATKKYQISIPDRQLACAPILSPEGKDYFGAMAASANYAWANRQLITHTTRQVLAKMFRLEYEDMPLVYDVAHNVAKIEEHTIEGKQQKVCVHRKGATRAFGPGSDELPAELKKIGQPVIIPGSMGARSYIVRGKGNPESFTSCAHGAGRRMSRTAAKEKFSQDDLKKQTEGVICRKDKAVIDEIPGAYKDIDTVMANQADLIEILHTLKQVVCVKG